MTNSESIEIRGGAPSKKMFYLALTLFIFFVALGLLIIYLDLTLTKKSDEPMSDFIIISAMTFLLSLTGSMAILHYRRWRENRLILTITKAGLELANGVKLAWGSLAEIRVYTQDLNTYKPWVKWLYGLLRLFAGKHAAGASWTSMEELGLTMRDSELANKTPLQKAIKFNRAIGTLSDYVIVRENSSPVPLIKILKDISQYSGLPIVPNNTIDFGDVPPPTSDSLISLVPGFKRNHDRFIYLILIIGIFGFITMFGANTYNDYSVKQAASIEDEGTDHDLTYYTYVDDQNRFEITYPDQLDWDYASEEDGEIVVFFDNLDENEDEFVSILISLVPEAEYTQFANLPEYLDAVKGDKIIDPEVEDYNFISERAVTLDGKEGWLIEDRFTFEGETFHSLEMIVPYENTVFNVTGVALDSEWEKYKPIIEAQLLSFRIL